MGIQPMSGLDDVEWHTIPCGDPDILEKKNKAKRDCRGWCVPGIFVFAVSVTMFVLVLHHLDAHYYVAIDSVSDLDRTRGLSFNLTLGVSSRSYGEACIEPGTYLEVSYRGALLAASEAEVGWLCAGPRKPAEQRVAARTTGAPEGHVLDSLATDMKQGAPLYEVTLHLPRGSYGVPYGTEGYWGSGWVSGCEATQVGGAAVWCDAPDQMPGYFGV